MNASERADFHADFERALAFATQLHAGQVRKQTDIPYISHLIAVAGLVLENGGDRDQAIAALLHDSIEDQGVSHPEGVIGLRQQIEAEFGSRVLEIVEVFGRRGLDHLAAELGRTVETMKALAG